MKKAQPPSRTKRRSARRMARRPAGVKALHAVCRRHFYCASARVNTLAPARLRHLILHEPDQPTGARHPHDRQTISPKPDSPRRPRRRPHTNCHTLGWTPCFVIVRFLIAGGGSSIWIPGPLFISKGTNANVRGESTRRCDRSAGVGLRHVQRCRRWGRGRRRPPSAATLADLPPR